MKKNLKFFSIFAMIGLLSLSLFIGCSNYSQNGSALLPDTQSISEEKLYQYFQQTYDAKGNALDTPEQLSLELSELTAIVATEESLPTDLEAQYRAWRNTHVQELLNNLQKEYDQLISERPRCDGINPGLCYANQIDFEQDGIPELLLFTAKEPESLGDYDGPTVTVEVYGNADRSAAIYGEETFSWINGEMGSFKLYTDENNIYWGCDNQGSGNWGGSLNKFYTVRDHKLILADHVSTETQYMDELQGMGDLYYRGCHGLEGFCKGDSNYGSLTYQQYNDILNKYKEYQEILSYPALDHFYPKVIDSGLLPPEADHEFVINVNGATIQSDQKAFMRFDGFDYYIFVPVKETLEKMGMSFFTEIEYETASLIGISKGDTVQFYDSDDMYVNEEGQNASLELIDNTLYILIQDLEKINETQVEWDKENWSVSITSKFSESDQIPEKEISAMRNFTFQEAGEIVESMGYLFYPAGGDSVYRNGKRQIIIPVYPLGTTEEAVDDISDSEILYLAVTYNGTVEIIN